GKGGEGAGGAADEDERGEGRGQEGARGGETHDPSGQERPEHLGVGEVEGIGKLARLVGVEVVAVGIEDLPERGAVVQVVVQEDDRLLFQGPALPEERRGEGGAKSQAQFAAGGVYWMIQRLVAVLQTYSKRLSKVCTRGVPSTSRI